MEVLNGEIVQIIVQIKIIRQIAPFDGVWRQILSFARPRTPSRRSKNWPSSRRIAKKQRNQTGGIIKRLNFENLRSLLRKRFRGPAFLFQVRTWILTQFTQIRNQNEFRALTGFESEKFGSRARWRVAKSCLAIRMLPVIGAGESAFRNRCSERDAAGGRQRMAVNKLADHQTAAI